MVQNIWSRLNVKIPRMNYLVEELSVCLKGVDIDVLDSVMYAISVSDGSKCLNRIKAADQWWSVWYFIVNIHFFQYVPGEYNNYNF